MPNLLAMSFEGELAPSFDLRCLRPGGKLPDGWGIGYYPGGEPAATVLKEPAPPTAASAASSSRPGSTSSRRSSCCTSAPPPGAASATPTPSRSRAAGAAATGCSRTRAASPSAGTWPRGSVRAGRLHRHRGRLLRAAEPDRRRRAGEPRPTATPTLLRTWFDEINDARHADQRPHRRPRPRASTPTARGRDGRLPLPTSSPPYDELVFGDADLEVDLSRRGIKEPQGRARLLEPAAVQATATSRRSWQPRGRRELARDRAPGRGHGRGRPARLRPWPRAAPARRLSWTAGSVPARAEVRNLVGHPPDAYRYAHAGRAQHAPAAPHPDARPPAVAARARAHRLGATASARLRRRLRQPGAAPAHRHARTPSSIIEARSRVELLDIDPLASAPLRARTTIPLVWMPWQRHMLQPFLLPPELPESQLHELAEYAMSFVERNDYDLLDTLLDLNASIFREYDYKQGTTTLATTPFDVYSQAARRLPGLHQPVHLPGAPARRARRATSAATSTPGRKNPNQRAGAGLARLGPGLPARGRLEGLRPDQRHPDPDRSRPRRGRAATTCDATPTSGTIYVGGGTETLEVDVRVELAEESS